MRKQTSHKFKSSLQVFYITFAELIVEFKEIHKPFLVVLEESTYLGDDKNGQRLIDQFCCYFDHPSPSYTVELSLVILIIAIVKVAQIGDDFTSRQWLQFHDLFRINGSQLQYQSRLIEEKLEILLLDPDVNKQLKDIRLIFFRRNDQKHS